MLDSASYMLLALVVWVGLDLVHANAVKSVLLLSTSLASIAVFWGHQQVDWTLGGLLALGSVVGSWIAARMAMKEWARVWVYRLLIAVVCAEIAQLAWQRISLWV